jgi:hypothetical protein
VELVRWVTQDEALETFRFLEHLGPEGGTKIYRVLTQEDMDRVFELYAGNPGLAWYSGVFGGVPPRP